MAEFSIGQSDSGVAGAQRRAAAVHFDLHGAADKQERPHEGINFERPAWLYTPSERAYSRKIAAIEYDTNLCTTRMIRTNGTMKWKGSEIFISELLIGENIALKPYNENEWIMYFSFFPIGIFNEKVQKVNKICY